MTSVNDLNMSYFISLMIKEDIPKLELIFTAINGPHIKLICYLPHKNPYSTQDGAKHV